jgi:hypothetical protein
MGDADRPRSDATATRWLALAVVLGTLLVNASVVGFDFVNWDDELHVLDNRALLQPGTVPLRDHLLTPYLGYPVPVTMLSYQLNRLLGGLDPAGYHLFNLLLFALSSWLVLQCGRALGARPGFAALGAALFAVHPASVETCAWVTGRKDLLGMLFLLLFVQLVLTRTDRRGRGLALAALVLSLASKPLALAIAPLCWVIDRYFHRMPIRQSVRFAALVLPVCAAFALITLRLEHQVGAVHVGRDLDWVGDALQAGHAHLLHLLAPVNLLPKYVEARDQVIDPLQLAVCVLAAVLLGAGMLRTRLTRPAVAVAITFIACVYLPVSGLIPLSRQIADTYLYGPLIGGAWLLALGAGRLAEVRPQLNRALGVVGVALVVMLVPLRLLTLENWRDPVALWSATMQRNALSPQVCRSLGNAYIFTYPGRDPQRLRPREAIAVYRHCLVSFGRPELYLKNLGIAHAMAGDFELARKVLGDALRWKPDDPTIHAYLRSLPARTPAPSPTPTTPPAP